MVLVRMGMISLRRAACLARTSDGSQWRRRLQRPRVSCAVPRASPEIARIPCESRARSPLRYSRRWNPRSPVAAKQVWKARSVRSNPAHHTTFLPAPLHIFFTPPSLSTSLFPLLGRKEISGLLAGAEFAVGAVAEPTSSELVEAVVQDFAEEKEMPLLAQ